MNKDYCPECCIPTNHKILHVEKTGNESGDEYQWNLDYEIIQCSGCVEKPVNLTT